MPSDRDVYKLYSRFTDELHYKDMKVSSMTTPTVGNLGLRGIRWTRKGAKQPQNESRSGSKPSSSSIILLVGISYNLSFSMKMCIAFGPVPQQLQ